MKTRNTLFFIVAIFYISLATVFAQSTLYVSPTGGNIPPYATLVDAATNIQDAVNAASAGDLVLVDDGTYVLSSNVSITKGITVRSINGYSSSIVDGNSVTRCFYINHANAVLDGFTIQNGYYPSGFGGGVNIVTGGTVQNCFITGSQARDGGGVAIDNSGLVFNCILTNNLADNNSSNGYGGGIRLLNGGTARNCLVYGNTSAALGGGINVWNAGTIENCTVVNNTGPNGAGIRLRGTAVMTNTISYFNNGNNIVTAETAGKTYTNNCTTPALPLGTGNVTVDPLFENYASNDFHLSSSSTLVNAGINLAWMTGAKDLDGNDRILETTVDIGAYEYLAASITPVSDDFFPETTIQSPWTFYDPVGDATLTWTGTNAEIAVPSGTEHDLWTGAGNKAPRMLQPAPDTDFQVVVKFESVPSSTYQLQGIIVQESNTKFIRFGSYYGSGPKFFVAVIDGGTLVQTPSVTTVGAIPPYLRVTRTGNNWTYEYSTNNSTWNAISSFTQAFTVNEVGFYAGNAGGNPAFTASADFFWNTADVGFTDTDTQTSTPPTIDVWYGDTQSFGNLGNPQQWVNILGRVSDDNGVASLTYSLNGAPDVSLAIGPNGTRLVGNGDFVTEIDHADLLAGANTVEFTAMDALGGQATKTVTINYSAGNIWPLPYTADWTTLSTIDDINNVANIADGLWELTPNGIHTVETGYDRLIVLGDETWTTNYEVTAEMTIHSVQSGSGVGFAIGWQGHTGTASPRTNWPLEAIGWVRNLNTLEILTYTSGTPASTGISLTAGTKYLLKNKSEDIGGGLSRFSVKIWEDGTTEPAAYMITADIADRAGSVLLITHKADVTWGTIQVNPLSGNTPPQFTSTPITIGVEGQLYTYNITASDPNTSDVLTISAPSLPSWLNFFDNGGGSATLTGTPSAANLGANIVGLLVSDGNGGSALQNFTITVTASGGSLPISDQFCGTSIEPYWSIFDPFAGNPGESTFGINNGALEISIPSGISHDLATNSAPRVLQTIPDADFGVEIKFNSAPSLKYQMQGIIVEGTGYRLRFETYSAPAPTFYANGYGVSFGSAVNQAIGGPIPAYLRLVRTGNSFAFDYSYDGTTWTNVVTRTITVAVERVGFYGANHNPNPAFTVSAEYFRNVNDPIPSCSVVEVTSPNGGEVWAGGSSQNITWTSTDVANVKLEYTTDGGAGWTTIIASTTAATGSYPWTTPNVSSTNCKVKISDVTNSALFSISAQPFSITPSIIPLDSPALVYPTNGLLNVPGTLTCQWNLTTGAHHYEIEIYSDAGLTTLVYSTLTSNLFKDVPPATLATNMTYYWRVRGIQVISSVSYLGTWSALWNFKTSSTPGGEVPLPQLSWPVGNALVYTLSPTLSWYLLTGSAGLTYEIQYSTISNFEGSPLPTTLTSSASSVGLTGLLPGTQYFWRVRAYNGITNLYSVFSAIESFTTDGSTGPIIPVPSWPTGGAMLYSNSTLLSWYFNSGIPAGLLYDIEINTTGLFTGTPTQSGITSLSTTVGGLTGGQTYHWKVRSTLSPFTPSAWSSEAVFVTEASVGGTPVIPIPSYPNGGAIVYSVTPTLSWYLSSGGPGLEYEIELKPAATVFDETGLFTSQTMSYATTNILNSGVNYHWRVRSTNGVAYSAWSAPALFTVSGTISGLPVVPIPSWPVGGALAYSINPLISWYLPTSVPGLTYEIHYGTSSGSYTDMVTSPTTYVSLSGLLAGTIYYYQVRSTNGSAFSAWCTEQTFQTTPGSGTAPSVPGTLWPSGGAIVYNTSPTLSWSMISTLGITQYRVKMSYAPDMSNPWFYTTTGFSYALTGLIPGTTYYWQVQSYNGSVYSAYSTPVQSFTVNPGSTAPVVPINGSPVAGMQVMSTSPVLSWYISAMPTGLTYELQYSSSENFSNAVTIDNISQMNQSLSGLMNGTTYYWRVRSKTADGLFSAYSYPGVFTPGSVTGAKTEEDIIPDKFDVSQNYPNPFNPSSTIKYGLPEAANVSIKVYNMLGQEIKTLVSEYKNAGTFSVSWNGDNNSGSKVSSGTYILRVVSGSNIKTMKMILMK